MKFEKINKDKIKVTINTDDLNQKDIDFHSFMSDSDESQSLFLDVLDIAERDFDFSTKNYNLKVETVALSDEIFILIITRIFDGDVSNSHLTNSNINKPKISRKKPNISSSMIYKFSSFDDFCNFVNMLDNILKLDYKKISKDSMLYLYNDTYYLIFLNINTKFYDLKKVFSIITEFATYVGSSDVLIAKILESGKPVFKNKAIMNCIHFFK